MFKAYKKKIQARIDSRVFEHCYHSLAEVNVLPVKGLQAAPFNYRCYYNACNFADMHRDAKGERLYDVIMGFYKHNHEDHISLHFWVRHKETCLDSEVSVGYLAKYKRYWEIRVIDEQDYKIIHSVFTDGLDYYKQLFTNRWERLFIEDGRIV